MSSAHGVDAVIRSVQREQRKHPRRSVDLRVRVFWRGESADLIDAPGVARDISAGGLGIELSENLSTGELLSVETPAGALQGIVRHVHQQADKCILGMEILAASDGSDHQRSLRNLKAVLEGAGESG